MLFLRIISFNIFVGLLLYKSSLKILYLILFFLITKSIKFSFEKIATFYYLKSEKKLMKSSKKERIIKKIRIRSAKFKIK